MITTRTMDALVPANSLFVAAARNGAPPTAQDKNKMEDLQTLSLFPEAPRGARLDAASKATSPSNHGSPPKPRAAPLSQQRSTATAAQRLARSGKLRLSGTSLPSYFADGAVPGSTNSALASPGSKRLFKGLAIGTGVVGTMAVAAGIVDAFAENKLHGECAHDNVSSRGAEAASEHCVWWENFDSVWAYVSIATLLGAGAGLCATGWFLTPAARFFFLGAGLLLLAAAALATVGQVRRHDLYKTCGRKSEYTTERCRNLDHTAYWMFRSVGEILVRGIIVLISGIFLAIMRA